MKVGATVDDPDEKELHLTAKIRARLAAVEVDCIELPPRESMREPPWLGEEWFATTDPQKPTDRS